MAFAPSVTSALGGGSLGTLFVTLTADTIKLTKGMDTAVLSVSSGAAQITSSVTKMAAAAAAAFATVGIIGLREFSKWELSFTQVRKTVDATDSELKKLAQTFRDLAKELPYNVNEMNRVAGAAGQLGIKKDNIVAFTKTMMEMGQTTNLSADLAADRMARFANVTQMPQAQFDRLGSTLSGLDRASATTADEIMEMGLRIAGAGTQLGMSEHAILGFATALSSLGVYAERGGTAISQAMISMDMAVNEGGHNLKMFAEIAGMSADQFTKAYAKDAVGAVMMFVSGLQKMSKEGKDFYGTLQELNIDGARMRDVLSRVTGAGSLFNDTMKLSSKLWQENNSLTTQASKFYETFSAQMTTTVNLMRDWAITMGEQLAPTVLQLNALLKALLADSSGFSDTIVGIVKFAIPALITGIGLIGDAIYGWKLIFKTVQLAFVSLIESMISGSASVAQVLSKLPGAKGFFNDGKGLKELQMGFTETRVKLQGELDQLAGSGTFSSRLLKDYDTFANGVKKANKSVVEDIKQSSAEVNKRIIETANLERNQAVKALTDMEIPGYTYGGKKGDKKAKRYQGLNIPGMQDPTERQFMDIRLEQDAAKEKLKILDDMNKKELALTKEQQEKKAELIKAYNERLKLLQMAEYQIVFGTSAKMFGDLASIAETWGGKQSAMYQAMFAASKAFAIAEATVQIMMGIAKAAGGAPWPANLAAMAQVVAATASIVSNISAVTLELSGANNKQVTPRATGGSVSAGDMYMVGERGPELFSPSMSGSIIPNHALGAPTQVNVHNYSSGHAEVKERTEGGQKIIDVIIRKVKSEIGSEIRDGRGELNKAIEGTFNLRRGKQ